MSIDRVLKIGFGLLVLSFCEPAHAQVVSFAPQGAEVLKALVGRSIPGVSAIDVQICSKNERLLSSGLVYQAAVASGLQPTSPLAMDALVSSELGRNRWRLASSALSILSHTGTVLLASGVIAATTGVTTGFAIGSGVADTLVDRFRARIPTFAWRKDMLDGDMLIPAGGCQNRMMFARYNKELTPRMADLGAPKFVERPLAQVVPHESTAPSATGVCAICRSAPRTDEVHTVFPNAAPNAPPPMLEPTERIVLAMAELERVLAEKTRQRERDRAYAAKEVLLHLAGDVRPRVYIH